MTDRNALRQSLKRLRRQLPESERQRAAADAIEHLRRLTWYRRARRLAAFIGSHGELDPRPLFEPAIAEGRELFLPVLHPFRTGLLWFCRWQPGEPLRNNRFGIPEPLPTASTLLRAGQLDLVIMPLLGFDDSCQRLGMGGGFYDRTFAFRQRQTVMHTPRLVGFAHELQRVASLPAQPWDVKPDIVVTNERVYHCRSVTSR